MVQNGAKNGSDWFKKWVRMVYKMVQNGVKNVKNVKNCRIIKKCKKIYKDCSLKKNVYLNMVK